MILIEGETCAQIWIDAVTHLRGMHDNRDCDVILGINTPSVVTETDRHIFSEVDGFLKSHGKQTIHTVAETIFPSHEYLRFGKEGVFERYPEKFDALKPCKKEIKWGTYAHRLVRCKGHNGEFNPLEKIVDKINNRPRDHHACYELGLDVPLYNPESDRHVYIGGPCLSHISIKIINGAVRLTALYRNHYYIERLLGNLLGLSRLQGFVAKETGLDIGKLIIHSSYACIDQGVKKVDLLLERCRGAT